MNKQNKIIGVDEVGYGAFAGPVFVSSIILLDNIVGITDSKKLTFAKRSYYYSLIKEKAIIGLGYSTAKEINNIGVRKATDNAIIKSLDNLINKIDGKYNIDKIIMDGNLFPGYYDYNYECIPKADFKVKEVIAASIVAKYLRDNYMINLNEKYYGYDFDKNMGYGTEKHREALKEIGISDIHRLKYVKRYV